MGGNNSTNFKNQQKYEINKIQEACRRGQLSDQYSDNTPMLKGKFKRRLSSEVLGQRNDENGSLGCEHEENQQRIRRHTFSLGGVGAKKFSAENKPQNSAESVSVKANETNSPPTNGILKAPSSQNEMNDYILRNTLTDPRAKGEAVSINANNLEDNTNNNYDYAVVTKTGTNSAKHDGQLDMNYDNTITVDIHSANQSTQGSESPNRNYYSDIDKKTEKSEESAPDYAVVVKPKERKPKRMNRTRRPVPDPEKINNNQTQDIVDNMTSVSANDNGNEYYKPLSTCFSHSPLHNAENMASNTANNTFENRVSSSSTAESLFIPPKSCKNAAINNNGLHDESPTKLFSREETSNKSPNKKMLKAIRDTSRDISLKYEVKDCSYDDTHKLNEDVTNNGTNILKKENDDPTVNKTDEVSYVVLKHNAEKNLERSEKVGSEIFGTEQPSCGSNSCNVTPSNQNATKSVACQADFPDDLDNLDLHIENVEDKTFENSFKMTLENEESTDRGVIILGNSCGESSTDTPIVQDPAKEASNEEEDIFATLSDFARSNEEEDIFATLSDFVRTPAPWSNENFTPAKRENNVKIRLNDANARVSEKSPVHRQNSFEIPQAIDQSAAIIHRRRSQHFASAENVSLELNKESSQTQLPSTLILRKKTNNTNLEYVANRLKSHRSSKSDGVPPPLPPRITITSGHTDRASGNNRDEDIASGLANVRPLSYQGDGDLLRPQRGRRVRVSGEEHYSNYTRFIGPPKKALTKMSGENIRTVSLEQNRPKDRPLPQVPSKFSQVFTSFRPVNYLPKKFFQINRNSQQQPSKKKADGQTTGKPIGRSKSFQQPQKQAAGSHSGEYHIEIGVKEGGDVSTSTEKIPDLPPKKSKSMYITEEEQHMCLLDVPLRQKGKILDSVSLQAKHTHDLFVAAGAGRTDYVKTLLNQTYVDVNTADIDGWTILHHACKSGNPETVRLLVDRGASINARTSFGCEPLMIALREKRKGDVLRHWHQKDVAQVVHELISVGSDVNLTDPSDLSAIMVALASENNFTVDYLLDNGANVNYPLHLRSILHVITSQVSLGVMWIELERKALELGARPNVTDIRDQVPAQLLFFNKFEQFKFGDVIKEAGHFGQEWDADNCDTSRWDKYLDLPVALRKAVPSTASFHYSPQRLSRFLRHLKAGLDLRKIPKTLIFNIDINLMKRQGFDIIRVFHACGHRPDFRSLSHHLGANRPDCFQELEEELSVPTSLMLLCASTIRSNIYPNATKGSLVNRLVLPKILKPYVTLDAYPCIKSEIDLCGQ